MLRDILRGLYYYSESIEVIREARLWKYFIYSGILGLLVFSVFGVLIYQTYDILGSTILNWIPWDIEWLDSLGNWLTLLSSSVLFLMLFRYIMLVVLAPLMSQLSAEVEAYIYREEARGTNIGTFFQETWRGIRIAFRNIIRELFWTVVLLLLGLFPLFSIIAGPAMIALQSYYAGFGTIDYWAERHMNYKETTSYLSAHKGMLIGNGIVYLFLIAIPFVGVVFIPTLSTVAGTLHASEKWEGNSN